MMGREVNKKSFRKFPICSDFVNRQLIRINQKTFQIFIQLSLRIKQEKQESAYQNGNCSIFGGLEGQVGAVRGPISGRIVHIVLIYDALHQVAILTKIGLGLQDFFGGDLWGDTDDIDERFLDDSKILQLLDLVLVQTRDLNFNSSLRGLKSQRLESFH